ncbi:transposase [Pseudoduganella lutea]|uniref:Transposase IS200-like domain-containing protein n=1 Tax=Pseudoduganella lutea TaxID=321985 RepID=A0A4P6L1V3_9BURK|nr:transposase [Pseudoduganella lutea]QBE64862.1 hypothetical protein EWM63_19225 [Pseudoduganella lutea]
MSRRPRLLLPGIPLHIIQRGHNRQPCFLSESDFLVYLEWLGSHASTVGCSIHAYVLMTNHVHILASFDEIRLAPELMRRLGQQYTLCFNKRCAVPAQYGKAVSGRIRFQPNGTS